ncbi:BrnT family toxin [Roseitalea porphyridii]|uniref:BrnT family toxin n=1 Tax=Roseitalea porphyridii TaxID=1852022 RepID=A0A4V1A3U6_9HYPH|nr:BrnT family toxin [Roseitalea porphyridii]QBK30348.1 BrnT family toxin [Roseitalea porphyridii]
MKIDGFDWDDGNWPKCAKHGVSKAEIEFVFNEGLVVFDDPNSTLAEPRFRGIGRTKDGARLFVAFCYRNRLGRILIRPISARYMHRKEAEHYERLRQST